jgi:endo-1,4-beta-xylanase
MPLSTGDKFTVTFAQPSGKTLIVGDENHRTIETIDVTKLGGTKLADGLFPEGRLHLGSVTSPKSKLTIGSLIVQKAPSGKWDDIPAATNQPTLRQLGKRHGISLGTEVEYRRLRDSRYWQIMRDEFDTAILSEFGGKEFWRGRGDYDFESLDNIVDWMIGNGWRIRASHLVWGAPQFLPDWLVKSRYSRDEYRQILKDHVQTLVGRYQGKVSEWSIANEASSRSLHSGADLWADKIGPEYIEMAFRWAREADPNATLIFNDDNNQSPQDLKSRQIVTQMYDTVKELKSKGVPIDGVGMQMHLLLPWNSQLLPKKHDVITTMRMFADLGVKIYITEFDVNLHSIQGSKEFRWDFEAKLYRDMAEACVESGVCQSFSTWGISDATSWITCTEWWCVKLPDADPLMFDRDLQPKPAYYAVRDALSQYHFGGTPGAPY